MEHSCEPRGLAGLDAERDDVLDLEVDRVADADTVGESFLDDVDRRAFDTEQLADEWSKARHGTPQLAAEDTRELFHLLIRRAVVDEDPDAPVPVGHHLRCVRDERERPSAHVSPLDVALTDVEDERDTAI